MIAAKATYPRSLRSTAHPVETLQTLSESVVQVTWRGLYQSSQGVSKPLHNLAPIESRATGLYLESFQLLLADLNKTCYTDTIVN